MCNLLGGLVLVQMGIPYRVVRGHVEGRIEGCIEGRIEGRV